MADNVAISEGVGKTIATDDVGGVQYQRVKISQGADGSATDVSSAAPLFVTGPYTEDAASASDPVGSVKILVRADTPAAITTTDGDNVAQRGTNYGAAYVQILDNGNKASIDTAGADNESNTSSRLNVRSHNSVFDGTNWDRMKGDSTDGLLVNLGTNNDVTATGSVAHDGADSGAPIKVGGRARSSEITAVASDDRSDFVTDLVGKQIVLPYANPENFVSGAITTAMTGTTSTSLIAAPGAGLRNYITQITVSNSHATVGTDLHLQDGNGGTAFYIIPAAAVYGGAVLTLPTPLRQPTANTALYIVNVTTGASTKAAASGYKGA